MRTLGVNSFATRVGEALRSSACVPIKPWAILNPDLFAMKVTAFHLAGKVEEAARSYFSNSFVFASRKIDIERTVDFRKGNASVVFFVMDGPDRVPMGGLEINTIQERDRKVAFQCRSTILPSGEVERFFVIMPEDSEQYSQYTRIAGILSKKWDKAMDAYLPKNEEAPQEVEAPKSLDDEYASLTPEEIEAITGVKPEPKGAPAQDKAAAAPVAGGDDMSVPDAASEEEIQRLMGMMMSGEQPAPGADKDASPIMSMEEIEALAKQAREEPAAAAGTKVAKPEPVAETDKPQEPADAEPSAADVMSAEDIWKQINNGGK